MKFRSKNNKNLLAISWCTKQFYICRLGKNGVIPLFTESFSLMDSNQTDIKFLVRVRFLKLCRLIWGSRLKVDPVDKPSSAVHSLGTGTKKLFAKGVHRRAEAAPYYWRHNFKLKEFGCV